MKITKSKLKQIINEELEILLREQKITPGPDWGKARKDPWSAASYKQSQEGINAAFRNPFSPSNRGVVQSLVDQGHPGMIQLVVHNRRKLPDAYRGLVKSGNKRAVAAFEKDNPVEVEPHGQTGPGHEKRRADWVKQQMGEFGAAPDYEAGEGQAAPGQPSTAPAGTEFGPEGQELRPTPGWGQSGPDWSSWGSEKMPGDKPMSLAPHHPSAVERPKHYKARETAQNPLNFQLAALRKATAPKP